MSIHIFPCARPGINFGLVIFGFPLAIEFKRDKAWHDWTLRFFLLIIKIVIIWGGKKK